MNDVKEGSCLCGDVRYEIQGELSDILVCHCENCRKHHGTAAAYTSVDKQEIRIIGEQNLIKCNLLNTKSEGN